MTCYGWRSICNIKNKYFPKNLNGPSGTNTPVDVLMVIMKMLFNNKGISLVILIVAMTLIAILGASFVSLMSTNKKVFCIK